MGKKPGRYAHILPTLPKFTPDAKKLERVERTIELVKQELPVLTASTLTQQFSELRKRKQWLKAVLKDVETKLDAYSALMLTYYEVEGISSLKLSDNAGVRLQPEVYAKVIDREQFRLWCIANGHEKELRLWPSTTQAVTRERLLNGDSAPDGVEATAKTKPVYMKGDMADPDDSWLEEYGEEFADEEQESHS